jgi:hypothetical protein
MKNLYILLAKEEGPNTFWEPTVWETLGRAVHSYPSVVYRENNNGTVEMLMATDEGPNTYWSLEDLLEDYEEPSLTDLGYSSKAVVKTEAIQEDLE